VGGLVPARQAPVAGGSETFRPPVLAGLSAGGDLALSPFFLFNAGSYFTHVPAAAAGALFCWMAADFLDQPRFSRGFLAGVALGILGLIRVFDPLLFGLPFFFAFVWRAGRRHYVLASSIIFGGLPFLAALLLFYGITSGSILPKIASPEAPLLEYGLYSVDENGLPHTPLDQLRLAARWMGELAVFTSPLLLPGYLAAFAWKAKKKKLNFFDFIFPVTMAALLFIPFDGGNRYGPRYYFDAYPFLVLTTVSALVPLLHGRDGRPRWSLLSLGTWLGASQLQYFWDGSSAGSSTSAWICTIRSAPKACPMPSSMTIGSPLLPREVTGPSSASIHCDNQIKSIRLKMRTAKMIRCLVLLIAGGVTLMLWAVPAQAVVWTFIETSCTSINGGCKLFPTLPAAIGAQL
jgi:hypothetical protein